MRYCPLDVAWNHLPEPFAEPFADRYAAPRHVARRWRNVTWNRYLWNRYLEPFYVLVLGPGAERAQTAHVGLDFVRAARPACLCHLCPPTRIAVSPKSPLARYVRKRDLEPLGCSGTTGSRLERSIGM